MATRKEETRGEGVYVFIAGSSLAEPGTDERPSGARSSRRSVIGPIFLMASTVTMRSFGVLGLHAHASVRSRSKTRVSGTAALISCINPQCVEVASVSKRLDTTKSNGVMVASAYGGN